MCGLESSVTTGRGFFSSGAEEKRGAHWAVTAVAEEQAAAVVAAAAARLFFSFRPSWFFSSSFFLRRNQTLGGNFPPPLLSLAHPSHVAVRVLDGWLLRNASCTPAGFQLSFSFLLSPTLFFLCAHPSSSSRWDEFGQTRRGSESTAAPRRGPRVSFTENFKQQPRNVRELKQRVFRHGLGRYTRPSAFSNSTPSFECNNSLFYEDRASALMASCHRGIRGSAGKCGALLWRSGETQRSASTRGQLR